MGFGSRLSTRRCGVKSKVKEFWPTGVEFMNDLTPAAWIGPRLLPPGGHGCGVPAGAVIPTGYPAYVRLLHPVFGPREASSLEGAGGRRPSRVPPADPVGEAAHTPPTGSRTPALEPSDRPHGCFAPTGTSTPPFQRDLDTCVDLLRNLGRLGTSPLEPRGLNLRRRSPPRRA
jgi:hypothetical protein